MLKLPTLLIGLLAGVAGFARAESRGGSEVVKLAQVEVKAIRPDFEFDVHYDDRSARVQEVVVTWVSPGTHKDGLRVGDRMASVDGKPVAEFSLVDLLAATKRKLGPGESQVLVFTGRRMLVRRATVTYTAKGPVLPAQPASESGTPRS